MEISALSIAPIIATRPNIYDLLLLKPDNKLSIITFNMIEVAIELQLDSREIGEICKDLDVSMVDASFDGDLSMTSVIDRLKIVSLKDSIHSSVTLLFEDGSKASLSLDLYPTDPLVLDMVQMLSVYVSTDLFYRIYKSFIVLWLREGKSDSADVQFDCIAQAILSKFNMAWKENTATKPTESSAWQSLASSPSHFRLYDDVALLDLEHHSPYPEHPPVQPVSALVKLHMSNVVTALHVLAEELRLVAHMHQALSRLAVLLARMCRIARPGWADYIKRLLPYSMEGWVSGMRLTPSDYSYLLMRNNRCRGSWQE